MASESSWAPVPPRRFCARWFLAVAIPCAACDKPPAVDKRPGSTYDDLVALPNAMAVRARGSELEGVAPDGALRWRLELEAGEIIVGGLCPAANSAVFLRTTQGLRAISAEGRWAWKADLPLESLKFDRDHYGPAALPDSSAVVLVDDRSYRSYSMTGQAGWQFDLPEGERPLTPPRSSPNGQVYVSSNVALYSIGPNGKPSWRSVR